MNIGIVGHEAAKFTQYGEKRARQLIWEILTKAENPTVVSGGCQLGGIDIWAEDMAFEYGIPKIIHLPENRVWSPKGYRDRNLRIVRDSHEVHCIAVVALPAEYQGMRFSTCYHCDRTDHVKGGGCWTMKQAIRAGKKGILHIVSND